MIRSIVLALFAVTLPASITAQEAVPQQALTIEGIAAVVNDEPITFFDVRQRARLLLMGLGIEPTQEIVAQVTNQALEQLIDERLQLQEAGEYEVVIDDSEIAAAVGDMAQRSGGDRDSLYAQLLQGGINPVSLEDQMRAEIAWRRIMGGLYGTRIRVSKNQIDDKLVQLEASAFDTQYNLSEIFLFVGSQDEMSQAITAATAIVEQLREGASFEAAAQQLSSAPTAATGGDMGWLSAKDINPLVLPALEAMQQPGVIDPIQVENGVYIYSLRSKQEPQEESSLVDLRQLVATDETAETLDAALEQIDGCDAIDAVADANGALTAITLGRIDEANLNSEMRIRVAATEAGSASEPYLVGASPSVVFVCDREIGGGGMPTRQQVEDRIYSDQLAMISQRALRNIKRDATIIRRQ
ncbi:MAG: peptidylprolyl isomerase [Hyphomonadaceae bacterium]